MTDTAKDRERAICKVTYWGALVNVILTPAKLLAGIFGHSSAMIADAVHSLSDFATDLAVIVFVKIASKPSDDCHDFGHGKFETLSTVIIGIALFLVGSGILFSGAEKIIGIYHGRSIQSPGTIALAAAVVSIIAKELLYRYTKRAGDLYKSSAVVANAWHHRSDAFSSIGTFIGIGGAILLGDKWLVLDPIAAVIVSLLIYKVAYSLVMPGINELLEKSLPKEIEDEILALVAEDPAVTAPHNLRTRRLGAGMVGQVHIRVDGEMSVSASHKLTQHIEERIVKRFGEWAHIIVHVEPKKNNTGFTLVEVLIALALGVLVMLPALGVFSASLKASGRTVTMCQGHAAAQAALQTTAAWLRRGEPTDDLQILQMPMRIVVRVRQGEDPATQSVTAVADGAAGESRSYSVVVFPPIKKSPPANLAEGMVP